MPNYPLLAEQLRQMHDFYPSKQMLFVGNLITLNVLKDFSWDEVSAKTGISLDVLLDWVKYQDDDLHVRRASTRIPTPSELKSLARVYNVSPNDFYADNTATWVIFHPARWKGLI